MRARTGGTSKITISLPSLVVKRVRAAVKSGRAPSVSAYIAAAVEERIQRDELAGLLDEMLAETGGPLTAAERVAAERAFRPARRKGSRGGVRS